MSASRDFGPSARSTIARRAATRPRVDSGIGRRHGPPLLQAHVASDGRATRHDEPATLVAGGQEVAPHRIGAVLEGRRGVIVALQLEVRLDPLVSLPLADHAEQPDDDDLTRGPHADPVQARRREGD